MHKDFDVETPSIKVSTLNAIDKAAEVLSHRVNLHFII